MKTTKYEATEDIIPGDLLYINKPKRNRLQKIIFWLMFWKMDKLYKVKSVESSTVIFIKNESSNNFDGSYYTQCRTP